MTSRERVLRSLNFDAPDRAPRDLWVLPGAVQRLGGALDELRLQWPGDITQVTAGKARSLRGSGDPHAVGHYTDEWGCVFENVQAGVMGEVKEPLLADWAGMERLRPPVELLEVDVGAADAFCGGEDRFVLASGWGRLFERVQFLRGTENVLMDLAEASGELFELIGRVHAFYLKQYEAWSRTRADALVLMDDWGSQRAMLISPAQWRRVFKPLYAQYASVAHASDKKFFMHSDGCIMDIYEDLIEIGVDAINSQLFCMDVEEIGRRFAGRMTFWGEIDRQQIMPFGSESEVEAAVERVHAALWRGGGAIAQFELGVDAPLGNAQAVYRTWDRLTAGPG